VATTVQWEWNVSTGGISGTLFVPPPTKGRDHPGKGVSSGLLVAPPKPALLRKGKQFSEEPVERLLDFHRRDCGSIWIKPGLKAWVVTRVWINQLAFYKQRDRHVQDSPD